MGRHGEVVYLAVLIADALYRQARFDEAQQMIDEANAQASPDELAATWLTQAKLLARRGQIDAALQLISQEEALLSPASLPLGAG